MVAKRDQAINMALYTSSTETSPPQTNTVPSISTTNNPPRSTRNPGSPRSPSRSKPRRGSKISVSTNTSTRSHKEYLDSLPTPSPERIAHIAAVQEKKELEIIKKRLSLSLDGDTIDENARQKAAELIQRNYRGHRERRMLNGMSLDPSTRWIEAIKEAQYRHINEPRPRVSTDAARSSMDSTYANGSSINGTGTSSAARQNWRKIGLIARRAGADEESDDSGSSEDLEIVGGEGDAAQRAERRKRRFEAKMERQRAAKIMDLQYFLEIVDLKHRYGSNLLIYHSQWLQSPSAENFFYWLDYGEGRFVECTGCSREKLERERVRYLSKEERLDYLVKVDKEGRLCWAKNGRRIDTSEGWRDSVNGIVPADDEETPVFRHAEGEAAIGRHVDDHEHDNGTTTSSEEDSEDERADKYATPEFDKAKGMKKVRHVSAATILNKLLRGSVKKNTWIFVADTSFRLYVGIKQSGAFQHSSFLYGSRVSAAGLIKIKNGRIEKLSPLSGHYRPPVSNFKAFIHNLKENGVDTSHMSISRSYAVLVGLEAYVRSRKRGKKLLDKLTHHRDKILEPDGVGVVEDGSQSAEKERRYLERKANEEQEKRGILPILEKLHLGNLRRSLEEGEKRGEKEVGEEESESRRDVDIDVEAPGTGPENAIAPKGTRSL